MSTGRVTRPVSLPAIEVSIERPALYVVATPIGNLGDLSVRAAAILSAVDLILSEDTRHSRKLLEHYGIATPMASLHEHNESALADGLLARMREQALACALISDAGTPLVSDPGYVLVARAHAADIAVVSVPGPCAAIAALSISGLATERFVFEGFLPAQARAREQRLRELAHESRTLVFYEAPHRIVAAVTALVEIFGGTREAAIARELTKRFETLYRGTLSALLARLQNDDDAVRGEFVLIVSGHAPAQVDDAQMERMLDTVLALTDRRTAVRVVAALSGASRNRVYQASLRVRGDDADVEI